VCEAGHSPLSSVEEKEEWRFNPAPGILFYGVHKENPAYLNLYGRSQNCEKRLWASSCLSVRPPGTTGRIFM